MKKLILKAIAGHLLGEEFIFKEPGAYIIGRSKYCALHIPNDKDMRISRQHLLLIFDENKTRVRDLGSKNGTTLNKIVLAPGKINETPEIEMPVDKEVIHGDYISLGDTVFLTKILPGKPDSEEDTIPLAENKKSKNKKSSVSKLLGRIVKKSPLSSSGKANLNGTDTSPVKIHSLRNPKKSSGKKMKDPETPIPLADLDEEGKTTLEIKEKLPPVKVPTKLKKRNAKKTNHAALSPIQPNPHLESESATTVMNQSELEELMTIDDTKFKVPEKLQKPSISDTSQPEH